MPAKNTSSILSSFLTSSKDAILLTAVAAGLYPILFYYSNNFSLVNSWEHLGFFVGSFLILPAVFFFLANTLFSTVPFLQKWQQYVLPFLGTFTFLFLMKVCLYAGIQKKITVGIIIVAALVALFLWKQYKKIIVLQLLLAIMGLFTVLPILSNQLFYTNAWTQQPDNIEDATFVKKPNVYFIQPDGYVNFSEIDKGYYSLDNDAFKQYLEVNNFKMYEDFRSNYASTLTSNSATFMMKHHYYGEGKSFTENTNARDIIISENATLSIFKNNGYKTYFLAEMPYLLLNKPALGYDVCNFSSHDVGYIGTGLGTYYDIITPLEAYTKEMAEQPKFFFIEIFNPGHIHGQKIKSLGIKGERALWQETLATANETLTKTLDVIQKNDPDALIVIMADHGGFVGMEYTQQAYTKTQDRDLIYSMFSSTLSIHWPQGNIPAFDINFKSAVNVFRILVSYLSEDTSYLEYLQDDSSYVILNEDAPGGVYKYIDTDGTIVFEALPE
ncbi:MAG: hypothetical protein ACJAYD_000684 [Patiriisocius sp.]|jgi:hypothetical protein